ncbi:MAG: M48 family metalloprotease [Pseudomonadota bacterium]
MSRSGRSRIFLQRLFAPIALGLIVVFTALPVRAQGLIRDAEIERTLRMLSDPLFQAAGLNPRSVEIFIVNDRNLNAFVAGGRRIFLNTGLLIRLETPAELQGVIAHEIGHITGGHAARRAIKARNAQGPALLGLLLGIAAAAAGGGEAAGAIIAGSQGALVRDFLRHTRGEEASADQAALTYMDRAGIDPSGLRKVFERFRGQELFTVGNIDPYAVTHPLSSQRIQLIERKISEIDPQKLQPSNETVYWHARMRAKLIGFLNNPETVLNKLEQGASGEDALYAKSVALHRVPSPGEAIAAINELIAQRPSDPFYIELKGQILHESGRSAEAAPYYRKASQLAPEEPLLKSGLGRVLLALDDPAADREALEALQAARRADFYDADGLRDLATAYARSGDNAMATLATAERLALRGSRDAILQAKRAMRLLPEGSPGWLRAQDILSLAQQ